MHAVVEVVPTHAVVKVLSTTDDITVFAYIRVFSRNHVLLGDVIFVAHGQTDRHNQH